MTKLKWCLLLLALSLTLPVFAADSLGKPAAKEKATLLSYKQYLTLIQKNLPELAQNFNQVKSAENSYLQQKGKNDFSLSANLVNSDKKNYSNSGTGEYARTNQTSFNTTLQKYFSQTGTTVSTGYNWGLNQQPDVDLASNQNQIQLTVQQPLLYNFCGLLDRYQLRNLALNIELAQLKAEIANQTLLTYYQKLYYAWIANQRLQNYSAATVKNSQILYAQVKRKVKAGLLENDSLEDAKISCLNLCLSAEIYNNKNCLLETEIFNIIKEESQPDKDEFSRLYQKVLQYNYQYVDFAQTKNAKLLNLSLKQADWQYQIAKKESWPELNLNAGLTQKAENANFGQALKMKDTDYSVALEFKYTIADHTKQAKMQEAQLQLKNLQQEKEKISLQYQKELKSLLCNIQSLQKQIEQKQQINRALVARYAVEKKKCQQARVSLQTLLDTESDIAKNQVSLVNLQQNLISAYFDYLILVR